MDKLTRALALLRGGAEADLQVVAPDLFDIPRICAVNDRPYIAVYHRHWNGKYRYLKSERTPDRSSGGSTAIIQVPVLDENGLAECCAWCGKSAFVINGHRILAVRCGRCGRFICLGLTEIVYGGLRSSSEYRSSSSFGPGGYSLSTSCTSQHSWEQDKVYFRCRNSCGDFGELGPNWTNSFGTPRNEILRPETRPRRLLR